MIQYTQGNLLDADVEALVNTVNTVGVMGKGIALMFKEQFKANYNEYVIACKAKEVVTGKMFVTETNALMGAKWIVNFPTKQHWRSKSKLEWIVDGLQELRQFIINNQVKSIAIPPLGSGYGGLDWSSVKQKVEEALGDINDVDIIIYEPIQKYQNVAKKDGVQKLTPARALIAELVRRYWVLGMECSLLEIQKLAWFLERAIEEVMVENAGLENPLKLKFVAHKFGPYADRLRHLLNSIDGSFLRCDKRINDADPLDTIWFDGQKADYLNTYLKSEEMKPYVGALETTSKLIDGFESPFGMELLATTDWLITNENCEANVQSIQQGINNWPAGEQSAKRKSSLFDARVIEIALNRLVETERLTA